MKKKFNQELLKEEQKRFKSLLEYDFYQEKKEEPKFKDLILGDKMDEADDEPTDLEPADSTDADANAIASELGVDGQDGQTPPAPAGDDSQGMPAPPSPEGQAPAEPATAPAAPEPASDDVEIDVTSLVQGSEEAKQSADSASHNTEMLLQKFSELESRIANMTAISDKIEGLEKEIIKRNPTPVEKLEMRSLDSFPFNQKLTDYWAEKEGPYDVMNQKKPKEYVLKKDDVDYDYTDASIKKTFSAPDDEYDEDEIDDYQEKDI